MPRDWSLDPLTSDAVRLAQILEASAVGLWEFDHRTGRSLWSRQTAELLDRCEADLLTLPEGWMSLVHPEDQANVRASIEAALAPDDPLFDAQFRMQRGDGEWRWVHSRGRVIERDPESGQPLRVAGTLSDITDRKEAEEAIWRLNAELEAQASQAAFELSLSRREQEESERQFRYAIEASNVGLWSWDLEDDAIYFSAAYAARLPLPPEGRALCWRDLLSADAYAIAVKNAEEQLSRDGHCEQELRIRLRDGRERWVLSRGQVSEWSETGEPVRAIGTHTDIDDRKRAEAQNRKLAAIIEASSDLIATATPDGEVDYMNRAGLALLGLGPTQSLERTRIQDYHPDWAYRLIAEEALPTAVERGQWLGDNALLRSDGTEAPVSQLVLAQHAPETGQIEFFSTICRDLSERLLVERRLRELQQEQELILDSVPALIWYKDDNNRMLRVNAAVAESLSRPKSQIEGRHTADCYPEDAERYYQDDLAVIRGGKPKLGIEEPYRLPSGQRRWIRTDKVPLKDPTGQVTRILVMALDITDRKEAEEALREADRCKDEFLAVLAHELRNPLAPIRSASDILRLADDNADLRERARLLIERQVEHLTRLVDDLLDLSRIRRGTIPLRHEPLAVSDIVAHAVETSRPLIEERQHALSLELPDEALFVDGDCVRLAQVVSNLLNNAANYTEPGGRIRLSVQREADEVVLRVQDTGKGISSELKERLFQMFVRGEHARDGADLGLGVGLSLTRQLVLLHHGSITANSAGDGEGSELVVRLPRIEPPAPVREPPAPEPPRVLSGHRILVADDDVDVAESLALLLDLLGQEVRIARDGLEAVEVAATFEPDLILLDLGMPRLNGFDACRRLRQVLNGRAVMIVALSGLGQAQHKSATQEAGFDRHLVKPASLAELQEILAALPVGEGE